ncbi:Alpha amylase, catalytic domain [Legionella massiliensis]|uniref:Alpha amylase, catalytic domain n=1 Tax=Legionella massiliensis TaxID=1034943 RepID=A0A078KXW6_9GAMM|nr:hypothetical protein [Legionella massiliensis]CDZ76573.1 Alpha amylase, catalytic domain [Legionella massiliensis]CEE12311.1 Alpha amylase, catalytic domain [Legionella massiliensis]
MRHRIHSDLMSKSEPSYPHNSILRMYNQFPFRLYADERLGIEQMTSYIPQIAAMNYNAVWINPLQATGSKSQLHPDGKNSVSGSLYAMSDDKALNPLIFPVPKSISEDEEQKELQQRQLRNWAKTVRDHGMFPLFDLVLNHIGIDEQGYNSLQLKLMEAESQTGLNLLLRETNARWPDIQGLDYYKTGTKKRGINTEPKDLDEAKIDLIFKLLWEPLITKYIIDYGFMGVRIDALTHIPVPVQQRIYQLVQELVRAKYGTDALIVGELMVGNAEPYLAALSACGLTHCMNPYSYFWGPDMEGGYDNSPKTSPFYQQNEQITHIILSPPKPIQSFKSLIVSHSDLNTSAKLQKETLYIFKRENLYYFAFNENETDICFNKAKITPIYALNRPSLLTLLTSHESIAEEIKQAGRSMGSQKTIKRDQQNAKVLEEAEAQRQRVLEKMAQSKKVQDTLLKEIEEIMRSPSLPNFPSQTKFAGGTVAVLGNHDVGTLQAKVMLDSAYSLALNNPMNDPVFKSQLSEIYKEFKQAVIKGVRSFNELVDKLQTRFQLSDIEVHQLIVELNMKMREKIFIQTMMSSGGWYSIAGDEFSLCHKPEVFSEFATSQFVGPSLTELAASANSQNDLRGFITGINAILDRLPKPSSQDKVTMYHAVLSSEDSHPDKHLYMVLHFSATTNQYQLIAHSSEAISRSRLFHEINKVFGEKLTLCQLLTIEQDGKVGSLIYQRDFAVSDDVEAEVPAEVEEVEEGRLGFKVLLKKNFWASPLLESIDSSAERNATNTSSSLGLS